MNVEHTYNRQDMLSSRNHGTTELLSPESS